MPLERHVAERRGQSPLAHIVNVPSRGNLGAQRGIEALQCRAEGTGHKGVPRAENLSLEGKEVGGCTFEENAGEKVGQCGLGRCCCRIVHGSSSLSRFLVDKRSGELPLICSGSSGSLTAALVAGVAIYPQKRNAVRSRKGMPR